MSRKKLRNFFIIGLIFTLECSHLFASPIETTYPITNLNSKTLVNRKSKRNAPVEDILFWDNGIVQYKFNDNDFSAEEKSQVRSAMQALSSVADISFIEKINIKENDNYVLIEKGNKCSSGIGNIKKIFNNYKQTIVLSDNGICFKRVALMHELMHLLGFYHEHSRFDRDQFVKIVEENIDPSKMHNFLKRRESTIRFGEYDYDSIMHYSYDSFGKNIKIDLTESTIKPLKEGAVLGAKENLSEGDKNGLIKAYGVSQKFSPAYIEFKNNAFFNAQIQMDYLYDHLDGDKPEYYGWWGHYGSSAIFTLPSNVKSVDVKISFRSIFSWYDLEYLTYRREDLPVCLVIWGTLFSPQYDRCEIN
ncbi:M12 family metallopeptidase [Fluviispira multicolorata]|uniref:Peptidase M12A domain-containing protein n=1 Tax=Fluviispira multicolorata TaxID=2654512 RepID=A0A833JGK1_9BACT|nr:M12 family metallopeptidase [Fluviispira multicolorata]KAB8032116.1 hypothetical protein GCL57_05570 [Fluviispira multicolorata]